MGPGRPGFPASGPGGGGRSRDSTNVVNDLPSPGGRGGGRNPAAKKMLGRKRQLLPPPNRHKVYKNADLVFRYNGRWGSSDTRKNLLSQGEPSPPPRGAVSPGRARPQTQGRRTQHFGRDGDQNVPAGGALRGVAPGPRGRTPHQLESRAHTLPPSSKAIGYERQTTPPLKE